MSKSLNHISTSTKRLTKKNTNGKKPSMQEMRSFYEKMY